MKTCSGATRPAYLENGVANGWRRPVDSTIQHSPAVGEERLRPYNSRFGTEWLYRSRVLIFSVVFVSDLRSIFILGVVDELCHLLVYSRLEVRF